MNQVVITPNVLVAVAGALLSLFLMFVPLFPKVGAGWDALTEAQKQAVNVFLMLVIAAGAGLLSCFAGFDYIECSRAGFEQLVVDFFTAATANAVVFVSFHKIGKASVSTIRS